MLFKNGVLGHAINSQDVLGIISSNKLQYRMLVKLLEAHSVDGLFAFQEGGENQQNRSGCFHATVCD
jgi:hypothetical protein